MEQYFRRRMFSDVPQDRQRFRGVPPAVALLCLLFVFIFEIAVDYIMVNAARSKGITYIFQVIKSTGLKNKKYYDLIWVVENA